jgi:hypothetical protein
MREPWSQLVSEVLYFVRAGEQAGDDARIATRIAAQRENLLSRLDVLSPGASLARVASSHLAPSAVEHWARRLCRLLVVSVDRLLFTDSLTADWRALAETHNLSRTPLLTANANAAARANASALQARHALALTQYNRLSRAFYDVLSSGRHLPMDAPSRCDGPIVVPAVSTPPPPPASPPSPPFVCVPTNQSGCRRDAGCCAHVEPTDAASRARIKRIGNVYCEPRGRGRPLVCEPSASR